MYPSITSQIGRSTVFWCKIKPICVCYENHIMHYQNPIFLTQLRNNGIIPVQDGQVQRYWSISRKPEKHIDYLICRRGLNHLLWSISLLHLCISVIFLMEMGNPPCRKKKSRCCTLAGLGNVRVTLTRPTNLGFADVHLKALKFHTVRSCSSSLSRGLNKIEMKPSTIQRHQL